MTSPKRVTTQQIEQRIKNEVSDYHDGLNEIQVFKNGEMSQPEYPNPVFKVELFTNTISDFVYGIQSVSDSFGKLELLTNHREGFESTINKTLTGYTKANLYFKKSPEMIEEDIKLISILAESNLRAEIKEFNENLVTAEKAELQRILNEEKAELEELERLANEADVRATRKIELQEKLRA